MGEVVQWCLSKKDGHDNDGDDDGDDDTAYLKAVLTR
jgi:hypothetical protein